MIISPSLVITTPVPMDSPPEPMLSIVTTLGAITATARAMFVSPTSFGSTVGEVTSEPLLEVVLADPPTRPPTMPAPNDMVSTTTSAKIRDPRGRVVGTAGGLFVQWESKLMK